MLLRTKIKKKMKFLCHSKNRALFTIFFRCGKLYLKNYFVKGMLTSRSRLLYLSPFNNINLKYTGKNTKYELKLRGMYSFAVLTFFKQEKGENQVCNEENKALA
jgi:hypothetical protein